MPSCVVNGTKGSALAHAHAHSPLVSQARTEVLINFYSGVAIQMKNMCGKFRVCQECLGDFASDVETCEAPRKPLQKRTDGSTFRWGFRGLLAHSVPGAAASVPLFGWCPSPIPHVNVGRCRAADTRTGFLTTTCRRRSSRFRGCTSYNKESASRRSVQHHAIVEIGIA